MTEIDDKTVSLILVVRNEEVGLRQVLPKISTDIFDDFFAIDGTSTDKSVELMKSFGYQAYPQVKRGLGSAMIEARERVKTHSFIYFHPDGNEDPADLPRMAELLRAGHEFVVASRMIQGAWNEEDDKVFKWRKYANQGFALLANVFFAHGGNRTSDVTHGFRGITCETFDRMNLSSRDLTMDYQMVIRALKLGIRITEFPTHEWPRIDGATNFASLPTGIAELKLLWREIAMGLRSAEGKELRIASKESLRREKFLDSTDHN
ncbi:MAG TPA: glycosyltransferase [Pyrinomonadaceae bacterium]